MSEEADFCVALNGPNVDVLSRLFFETLIRKCDLSGITVHAVCKGLKPKEYQLIQAFGSRMKLVMHDLTTPMLEGYGPYRHGPTDMDCSTHTFQDTGRTANWMVKNCGTHDLCFISHFDLVIRSDVIKYMLGYAGPDVGMVGGHDPILVLRRRAFNQCVVGFETLSYFVVVPGHEANTVNLRYAADPRAAGGQRVLGFDTGELLELNIRAKGWNVIPLPERMEFVKHLRGGSGWHQEGNVVALRRNEAFGLLNSVGISAEGLT